MKSNETNSVGQNLRAFSRDIKLAHTICPALRIGCHMAIAQEQTILWTEWM